jgi:hypothetical protein
MALHVAHRPKDPPATVKRGMLLLTRHYEPDEDAVRQAIEVLLRLSIDSDIHRVSPDVEAANGGREAGRDDQVLPGRST